jgi:hypothetical protein
MIGTDANGNIIKEKKQKKKKFIDLFQWLGPESNGLFLLNQ